MEEVESEEMDDEGHPPPKSPKAGRLKSMCGSRETPLSYPPRQLQIGMQEEPRIKGDKNSQTQINKYIRIKESQDSEFLISNNLILSVNYQPKPRTRNGLK